MDIDIVAARTEQFSGRYSWMYQDNQGYITVGIAHLVGSPEDAQKLIWIGTTDKQAPTDQLIASCWLTIKKARKYMAANFYAPLTNIRMPDDAITDLLIKTDVPEVLHQLDMLLPDWKHWPENARQAIFDMTFDLGITRLIQEFPTMITACKAGDWSTAGKNSSRVHPVTHDRNVAIRKLLLSCA